MLSVKQGATNAWMGIRPDTKLRQASKGHRVLCLVLTQAHNERSVPRGGESRAAVVRQGTPECDGCIEGLRREAAGYCVAPWPVTGAKRR